MAPDIILANLHTNGACSSLILYFFNKYEPPHKDFENHNYCNSTQKDFNKRVKYLFEKGGNIPSLTGSYAPKSHAFVVASTNEHNIEIKKYLDDLGFMSTEPEENKKNETTVQLHIITVKQLMKNLENV